jgi:cytochrome P450
MGWDHSFAFMDYGKEFQQQRRLAHSWLVPRRVAEFEPDLCMEAKVLVQGLLRDGPTSKDKKFERYELVLFLHFSFLSPGFLDFRPL